MTTQIENELSKMKCNLLDVLVCIKKLVQGQKYLQTVIADDTVCIKARLSALKKMLLSDDYSEKDASDLLIYIETYQLLARRLKNCTNLDTLKAENRIATARINRMSKSCQNIAHRAVWIEVIGAQRENGASRGQIL
jgi:hypothetical protein